MCEGHSSACCKLNTPQVFLIFGPLATFNTSVQGDVLWTCFWEGLLFQQASRAYTGCFLWGTNCHTDSLRHPPYKMIENMWDIPSGSGSFFGCWTKKLNLIKIQNYKQNEIQIQSVSLQKMCLYCSGLHSSVPVTKPPIQMLLPAACILSLPCLASALRWLIHTYINTMRQGQREPLGRNVHLLPTGKENVFCFL